MRIGILAPINWRTPPRHYGPWEQVASNIAEGLVREGHEVWLFATADSRTSGRLLATCPRPLFEDPTLDKKVEEYLHIGHAFEKAQELGLDLLHNHLDFMPLVFSRLSPVPVLTTIHGFSDLRIVPVYERYDGQVGYVSISYADRNPRLTYLANVYHGIDLTDFTFQSSPGDHLLFLGRISPQKGVHHAIEVAQRTGIPLIIAGIVQDQEYFEEKIRPCLDGKRIQYVGSVGPADRDRLLGSALALLHLIEFEEPFGLSLVEAWACGTPVIAFPRGSIPELLSDGRTGWVVRSVQEAVRAVERLPELSRAACRQEVEHRFTQQIMVRKYLEVYHDFLKQRAHRVEAGSSTV